MKRFNSPGEAGRSCRSTKWTFTRRSAKNRKAFRVSELFLMPKIWTSIGGNLLQNHLISDGESSPPFVHCVLTEHHLAFNLAVRRQGAKRLLATDRGGLIGGRDQAPSARLDDPESDIADLDSLPAILLVWAGTRHHEVGSKTIHGHWLGQAPVEVRQRL